MDGMQTRWIRWPLAALLMGWLTGLTGSNFLWAQPSAVEVRVARLITRLASDSYLERTQASRELAELGIEGREQLEAAQEHADPEVRLLAKDLLRAIKVDELWTPGQARFPTGRQKASTLLKELSEQTGNRVLLGDQYGNFQDEEIDLGADKADFWPVVDQICRATGNRVRPHYDTRNPGLVVVGGVPGKFPAAYAGPVRAQITTARRVFSEELDYETLGSELSHSFQLNLQMMWEDQFRLVAYRSQPELVAAVTDTGVELAATQPASSGWNVAGSGTRQLTMNLRLHPPPVSARKLDRLALRWGLIAVGDMATLDVADLAVDTPHFQDDVQLRVDALEVGPGSRCELSVRILRDLIVPDPQDVIFQESELELLDAQGRPFRRQGQTNSFSEGAARMKVTFVGESSTSQPAALRLHYPRIRAMKLVDIEFRDVPLPVARPE